MNRKIGQSYRPVSGSIVDRMIRLNGRGHPLDKPVGDYYRERKEKREDLAYRARSG